MRILIAISLFYSHILLFTPQSWAQKQSITQPDSKSAKDSPYLLEPLTGGEYTIPPPHINGHPFVRQKEYLDGIFVVNQKSYEKIPLNYDILQDVLVTFHTIHRKQMILHHDKVEYFELGEQGTFIYLKENPGYIWHRNGIYELLWEYQGKYLISKHFKTIKLESNQIERPHKYLMTSHFFLLENDKFVRIRSKNRLIKILGIDKKQVKKDLKAKDLTYNRNPSDCLVVITSHFRP